MKQSVSVQTFPMCNCVKKKKKSAERDPEMGEKENNFPIGIYPKIGKYFIMDARAMF